MERRDFLKNVGAGATAVSLPTFLHACAKERGKKPNVLFVFTDQQTYHALSATGNKYLKTPNMDRIAAKGVAFTNSYCTSPVCGPSRSSLLTGRMPHETKVNFNDEKPIKKVFDNSMGYLFRDAGYETVWGGKWHLNESYPTRDGRSHKIEGFDIIEFYDPSAEDWVFGWNTDTDLTDHVLEYLDNRKEPEKPLLLCVSYHNPHDICFYVRNPELFTPLDEIKDLPPLPVNNAVDPNEPELVQLCRVKDNYGFETNKASGFTDKQWCGYLYDYYRLTERIDREIGRLLDAFEEKGMMDDTLIVFTSDHGDGTASHKWHSKVILYEEAAAVPFLISYQGKIPQNVIDKKHLVSGVDLLPTLCDYAGIKVPEKVRGNSLRPILENPELKGAEFVVTELAPFKEDTLGGKYFNWRGRMVRTSDYKYCVYSEGERNEQLFDINNDRSEMNNLANKPEYKDTVKKHREHLKQWIAKTDDDFVMPEFA